MEAAAVSIRPWTVDDYPVLVRNDVPEMNTYLGGSEGEERLLRRHALYLREQAEGVAHPFTVHVAGEHEPVGTVAYWDTEHDGEAVYECSWAIVPGQQGNGYAGKAIRLALLHAAGRRDRRFVYAFPRIDNGPSNGLASAAGFELTGVEDFEYPKGVPIKVNAWRFDLATLG
ncbi:GNAT family N-acetyltransferase [Planctomonas sp. JC2975]|uniref:GNAT family N-acetyltransferase n=1 Tax=Planctomonas sp. JC2975 TaxID=2729626 RepID=UPI0014737530|nr:GNAT family protein [Planctomonas sp. JC2975]NNC11739.1 GNAT family N-acetyltransferase [Planctomonas sp. JC2975]